MRYTRGPLKHERTMNKHEGGFVLSNETHQKPIETQDNNEQMWGGGASFVKQRYTPRVNQKTR